MKRLLFTLLILNLWIQSFAVTPGQYVATQAGKGRFPLTLKGQVAAMLTGPDEYAGVRRAMKSLEADIIRVTGAKPAPSPDSKDPKELILVGTLGKSPLIDKLVSDKKIDLSGLVGKWETYVTQVVDNPMPGVDPALVIAGSDKRGTIYGLYDLSAQIGVSPWHWWADVPVQTQKALYVLPGRHTAGTPAVKYRGIFINDEAPALSGWTKAKFGGFNHQFYEHVFELILRLKGNYLWPAMWGNAFYDDDPQNPKLADEYGVVIGTSHHEPLMRAHDEWRRYGKGPWNYQTNDSTLRAFWRKSVERMGTNESILSVGMRGDGDEPMSRETATALLEKIVADQRTIISDVTGKPAAETPQSWALYKEVQDYYDKGMRVPDDVTLLLCDDNWGNLRKLPTVGTPKRKGGYGIYYHYDYVGGPRNYKWLNTNTIARTREQMHLAYEHGVDQIWIVNVGDIKPMEFPIEFFLDYAWNPNAWPADKLTDYTRLWAQQQFGPKHAEAIARILTTYTQYNARRKPELLSPDTYSLTHYREAERVVADYNQLLSEAERIGKDLPTSYQDAYFQLVLHPVKASATLNELYVTAGRNRLYVKQGRSAANSLADRVKKLFERDAQITRFYNDTLAGGKWTHMMDQTHIGYTYWQQPNQNAMPKTETISVPTPADMGLTVEGSDDWFPGSAGSSLTLPTFDKYNQQTYYIDLFNRGQTPFTFQASAGAPWLTLSTTGGTVGQETRLLVGVNWKQAPAGTQQVPITLTGPNGQRVVVQAVVNNPASPLLDPAVGFVESNGYVSIDAEHPTHTTQTATATWQRLPDIGRTAGGMTSSPVTTPAIEQPGGQSPRLTYQVILADSGMVQVQTYVSPTLNFNDNKGLRFAISFDDETPQIVNMHANETGRVWEQSVANNIRILTTKHRLTKPGEHTLKYWLVDPAVVVQKFVIDRGGVKPSYLGPPESFRRDAPTMSHK
ncbi:glycosyl hydrolase 115 family protein [Spirosoma rhododendri]|uniref:Glycosyl hydrolase n=1 Tax=Spirosoma rhododendri TaxID=2728024 RepID=A0A7L5DMB4_9BACT|nr:glycosyl hydrolase 115 family protein [Spirosoma rhododendri]QJD79265.1 glycosyl hydrolase [Spirosoma rhododendri]